VPGPSERLEVQLEHRDAARIDPSGREPVPEGGCPPRMDLDGEDATTAPHERHGQRALSGAEVDHHVTGADR
jgi:hypothetical protein